MILQQIRCVRNWLPSTQTNIGLSWTTRKRVECQFFFNLCIYQNTRSRVYTFVFSRRWSFSHGFCAYSVIGGVNIYDVIVSVDAMPRRMFCYSFCYNHHDFLADCRFFLRVLSFVKLWWIYLIPLSVFLELDHKVNIIFYITSSKNVKHDN